MSDQAEPKDVNPTKDVESRAVVPVRERLIVQAPVAIWDTADFEQMQRVAIVLTRSGLVPDTLCKEKDEWLPEATIAARCTLICNQARLWGADPLNVLQCTSLINGRLMYEGKLIAAVVASMTGVKLRYRFGVWKTDHIEFPENEEGLRGAGESLAVRCFDPDDQDRFVDGSVGMWKTTRAGNPWSSANAWPRQLRYRASREWARAYEPGVILGIIADGDQDLEEITMSAKPVGLMQRLKGEQSGDGFDKDAVDAQTGPKKRGRKPKDTAAEEPSNPEAKTYEAPQSEESPTDEPETMAEEPAAEPDPAADKPSHAEMAPHAAPGEVYLLAGDGYNNDKRRITYKDGVRFSTVHKDSEKKHTVYARHAPEIVAEDVPDIYNDDSGPRTIEESVRGVEPMQDGEEAPEGILERPTSAEDATETDGAPDAEPEPDTSEPATPASDDGPETSDSGPSAEAASEFDEFVEAVESAPLWADVKKAMKQFFPTDAFRNLTPDRQNKIRASTWEACVERKGKGEMKDLPDHGQDVTAFRLWLEWIGDPDAINGTLYALQRGDQWKAAPEPTKKSLIDAVRARLEALT